MCETSGKVSGGGHTHTSDSAQINAILLCSDRTVDRSLSNHNDCALPINAILAHTLSSDSDAMDTNTSAGDEGQSTLKNLDRARMHSDTLLKKWFLPCRKQNPTNPHPPKTASITGGAQTK